MFEDVFEPFDDIVDEGIESTDEWNTGDTWDIGEKEDVWRSDPDSGGVWSVDSKEQTVQPKQPDPPISQPGPMSSPGKEPATNDTECEDETCNCDEDGGCSDCQGGQSQGSGLFDDIFLDIF